MPAIEGTTMTTDFSVRAREIDFVTRFGSNWTALMDILGIARPIRKAPGTTLVSYKASIELEDGNVPEGEEIPFSKATVTTVPYEELTIEKYAKAVTIEAVNKYGARLAVQKTDDAFLNELQGKVMDRFYDFLGTGTLAVEAADFQMGVALAVGSVIDKFKKMHLSATRVVVFVNTLDAYRYLGAAQLTVQNEFGVNYIKNFLGAEKLILSSEIESGKIIATASENLILYYADPGDGEFKELGLDYTVQGETNLIGFHAEGNYSHAMGENYALMGMKLMAEYIDAVAVVTVGAGTEE